MMQQYQPNSYLFGGNAPYVEELYEAYLDNPGSVPDTWRDYFDALQHVPAVRRHAATATSPTRPSIESFAAARQGQGLRSARVSASARPADSRRKQVARPVS